MAGFAALLASLAFFKYTNPHTGLSLTACACDKCGSTTLMSVLYNAIAAHPSSTVHQHNIRNWHEPGVHATGQPGDVHFHVVRDPIERYISAWHSRLQCCNGTTTRACFSKHAVVQSLATMANRPHVQCFTFTDFVDTLHSMHTKGKQGGLNPHLLPQDLACPKPDQKAFVFRGDIAKVACALEALSPKYFARPIKVPLHHHSTTREAIHNVSDVHGETLRRLCEVAAPEYKWLDWELPRPCARLQHVLAVLRHPRHSAH